jgi:UDP-N-acetylmuramoyl-tripeptide--D-alanyl-D-alanine ligase
VKLTLGQIADWIHAEGVFDTGAEALGYSIDSRTIGAGELFFAVKGERVEGHDYVEAALGAGAVAAVVNRRWLKPAGVEEARLLRISEGEVDGDCVLESMQWLANRVRRAWGRRVIGVTGSAGKTTTKDCVAAVLATKFKVLKSEGNLNNHFGLPLQLLRLEPEHEAAVVEMGMNHAGEIRALAKIAEPDWAVVSNVAAVHLEHFADGIEGIARAKYELVESLPEAGVAVLNGDDDWVRGFGRGMGERAVLYGVSDGCAVRAVEIEELGLNGTEFTVVVGENRFPIRLRLPGRHNVLNALAAVTVGMLSEVYLLDAYGALERLRPTERRGNVIAWHGAEIVNDTYNSNPRALEGMVAALRKTEAKRRIVVAGEMLELGTEGASLHRSCGTAMAGLDFVLGVRGLAKELVDAAKAAGVATGFVETPELAGEWLRGNLRAGDVVLVKGSRGVRLERALEGLGRS